MVDVILAVIALLGLAAYFIPLIQKVPDAALITVLCIVILMAAFDFALELRFNRKNGNGRSQ
ncbi:hypothetical protein L598_000200000530 [Mesorhizobium sp. J18]|uniref:hypothetical protein n=1 Tax=Mesorhizobium sp. J18 TaxID=935263 RepID=UPI001199CF52|nr:hypothetical protein [Mesorhizobium sp. J18]TWG97914.1 hypothetical protein L598_000200000530 [Mesorhizobium sp. J18]